MDSSTLPVRHIGAMSALCDGRLAASLRTDLGSKRYEQLGVRERFKDEEPYRICKRCIAQIKAYEER